jgi:aspartyl-tRNA(Asn)/glutamyl-tRNA(Gln) amidotransferase subunit A
MDLHYLGIADAAERIARGTLTSLELTQAHLERIEQLDPQLGAYVTVTKERALHAPNRPTGNCRKASGGGRCMAFRLPSKT